MSCLHWNSNFRNVWGQSKTRFHIVEMFWVCAGKGYMLGCAKEVHMLGRGNGVAPVCNPVVVSQAGALACVHHRHSSKDCSVPSSSTSRPSCTCLMPTPSFISTPSSYAQTPLQRYWQGKP